MQVALHCDLRTPSLEGLNLYFAFSASDHLFELQLLLN